MVQGLPDQGETSVFFLSANEAQECRLWCRDEECHLSDEGEWLCIKLQIGLPECSFASASPIAPPPPVLMKVSSYNEAFLCECLRRSGFWKHSSHTVDDNTWLSFSHSGFSGYELLMWKATEDAYTELLHHVELMNGSAWLDVTVLIT